MGWERNNWSIECKPPIYNILCCHIYSISFDSIVNFNQDECWNSEFSCACSQDVVEKNFVHMSYTDAVELLLGSKTKFEFPVMLNWQPLWHIFIIENHLMCFIAIYLVFRVSIKIQAYSFVKGFFSYSECLFMSSRLSVGSHINVNDEWDQMLTILISMNSFVYCVFFLGFTCRSSFLEPANFQLGILPDYH